MAIRYDKGYSQYIAKSVRSYNAKIKRLSKKGYDYLPSSITVTDLKRQYDDRVSLNRELRRLNLFIQKGGEKKAPTLVPMTMSEYKNLKANLAVAKRIRTKYEKEMRTATGTIAGTPMDATFRQMGHPLYTAAVKNRELLNVNIKTASLQNIQRLSQRIQNSFYISARQEMFKINMVEKLKFMISLGGMSEEQQLEFGKLLTRIENMKAKDALSLFTKETIFDMVRQISSNPEEFGNDYFAELAGIVESIVDNGEEIVNKYDSTYDGPEAE